MVPTGPLTDRFAGQVVPDVEGLWSFRVDAWSDPWATWRHAVDVKTRAGQGAAELSNDLESGARLLERAADGIEQRLRDTPRVADDDPASERTGGIAMPPVLDLARTLTKAAADLRDTDLDLPERLGLALSVPVHRTMTEYPVRELVTEGETHHVSGRAPARAGRRLVRVLPRSTGGWDAEGRPVHGTFATATRELDRAAAMGFDIAYLPPIHPVGTVNRKGPNNTLTPGPEDVGSPWAIGSAAGGHDAIDPNLGTIEDFDAFVAHAHELGLEVALDLALQCAPDHPWALEHPEWFTIRPDGTIAYAENPPKKYQDIYPVNFDTDPDGIYAEVLRIVLYWMEHGVRVFRVDNPHTKPPNFWAWLIAEVHRRDPGVIFLAEAFTRPARLFGLAKAGFSQCYTYFTWRTGRDELREFFELHRDRLDECRPNCFVNTPDILHESLQLGGPGMFAIRAALAATLSPSWGVYAGFELFEHQAVRPGSEEYLDSEKYQLRPRDFAGALAEGRSLEPWITRLNQLRRAHPALRQLRTVRFHDTDNEALLALLEDRPAHRRHGAVRRDAQPVRHRGGQPAPRHGRPGPRAPRPVRGVRRGQRADVRVGRDQLRAPRAVARRRARHLGAAPQPSRPPPCAPAENRAHRARSGRAGRWTGREHSGGQPCASSSPWRSVWPSRSPSSSWSGRPSGSGACSACWCCPRSSASGRCATRAGARWSSSAAPRAPGGPPRPRSPTACTWRSPGVLLVVPGLLSTLAALVLLVPPVRRALARRAADRAVRAGSARMGPTVTVAGVGGPAGAAGPTWGARPDPAGTRSFRGTVIEARPPTTPTPDGRRAAVRPVPRVAGLDH